MHPSSVGIRLTHQTSPFDVPTTAAVYQSPLEVKDDLLVTIRTETGAGNAGIEVLDSDGHHGTDTVDAGWRHWQRNRFPNSGTLILLVVKAT